MSDGEISKPAPGRVSFPGQVYYSALFDSAEDVSVTAKATILIAKLPGLWTSAYLTMGARETNVCVIRHGTFHYIYDAYALIEASGKIPYDPIQESRLVAAFGVSKPQLSVRDDFRLKKWVGGTEAFFGKAWDKGHFIAHSIGGAVDKCELNVFVQSRKLNRGWTMEGKLFRRMEKYCAQNPGTFCFSRPIYTDGSARPALLEFGLLKSDGAPWVEVFDNRS